VSLSLFSIGRRVLPFIVVLSVFPVHHASAQEKVAEESLLLIGGDETPAQQAQGAQEPQVSLVSSWDFIRMLLILAAVIAVIYLVFRLLRRGMRRQLPQNDLIRLLGTRALTGNRALHVVELGNKVFLVGAAENGISLISEITDQETLDGVRLATSQAPPQTIQGFGQFLQSFLHFPQKHGGNSQDTLDFMKQQRQRLQKL
jgi:flagellar protein FliO/FliZ